MKLAVGCLVQWYEIDMFEEYLTSLTKSIGTQKENVLIDMCLSTNQDLEKIDTSTDMLTYVMYKYLKVCNEYRLEGYQIEYTITEKLFTIADYRREFNEKYCEQVEVLLWGESDMLVPS